MASPLHSMTPSLHHQDPWRYSLSSQDHAYPHHTAMHNLAYSSMSSSSSRYPHYGTLLPPAATSRLGAVPPQCELSKHSPDPWSSRFHHSDSLSTNIPHHYEPHLHNVHTAITAGGIDSGGLQEAGKDSGYWF